MTSVESARPVPSWTRIDGVDLLRGLAILLVLMNHVNMRLLFASVPYTRGLPHQLVSSLVWNGQRGVQIFFAISGFLITSTALRRWGSLKAVNIGDFYRLRFARIGPLLLALLAVLSILHLAHFENFAVSSKTGGLGRALIAALTFHVNVLEARRGYLPANWDILWSLSVEEVFYLFFPLICRLAGRGKLLSVILAGFVVLGPFARAMFSNGNDVWREYSYLGGMDAIALGCITAIVLSRRNLSRRAVWLARGAGLALLVFSLGFTRLTEQWGLYRSGLDMSIVALGACMLAAAAATTRWQSPRLFSPLARLGQRSYEVYLTHMFVVFAFFAVFVRIGKPVIGVPALFIAVIVIAGLLGEVVARFYSEPMNRLLRQRWNDGPNLLGSVVDGSETVRVIEDTVV